MRTGCIYVRLLYPGYIGLKENVIYQFSVLDRLATVKILQHKSAVEIIDFDNSLTYDEFGTVLAKPKFDISLENLTMTIGEQDIYKVIDYQDDKDIIFKSIDYTELQISFEIEEAFKEGIHDVIYYTSALEKFINTYRFITNDINVQVPTNALFEELIVRTYTLHYTPEDLSEDEFYRLTKERTLGEFTINRLYGSHAGARRVGHDIDSCSEMMTDFFRDNHTIPNGRQALLKAYEEAYINRNYKYALLECFIAIESVVVGYLTAEKLKRGISKKKVDDYKTQVGISYLLNIEFPLITTLNEDEKKIIFAVNEVRKIRNGVVHEGKDVSEKEAKKSIESVDKLMKLISDKQK